MRPSKRRKRFSEAIKGSPLYKDILVTIYNQRILEYEKKYTDLHGEPPGEHLKEAFSSHARIGIDEVVDNLIEKLANIEIPQSDTAFLLRHGSIFFAFFGTVLWTCVSLILVSLKEIMPGLGITATPGISDLCFSAATLILVVIWAVAVIKKELIS